MPSRIALACTSLFALALCSGQGVSQRRAEHPAPGDLSLNSPAEPAAAAESTALAEPYILGPEDTLQIRVLDAEEIGTPPTPSTFAATSICPA